MTPLTRSVLTFIIAATSLAGCMGLSRPVATPADLERLGSRTYPNRGRDEVVQASVTALKVLGYEIVTTDPRIRTAPKPVATTAQGSYVAGSSRARSFTESVAWDIDVSAQGAGSALRATPRASVNGTPMEQVYVEWAERTFAELMKEIDASLPAK